VLGGDHHGLCLSKKNSKIITLVLSSVSRTT